MSSMIRTAEPGAISVPVTLSNALKAARERAGYSLDDLAVTCGLTVGEIFNVETEIDADPLKVGRMAAALRLSVHSL